MSEVPVQTSLRTAARRATLLFLLVMVTGGAFIGFILQTAEKGPVAQIIKTDFKPIPVRAPDRPAQYPEQLPTLDNISVVSVVAKPGVIVVHIASPDTPGAFVDEVVSSFTRDGWEMSFAVGATDLAGGAVLNAKTVGVYVTPSAVKGAPKGWTSAIIVIQNDEVEVQKADTQPQVKQGPKA